MDGVTDAPFRFIQQKYGQPSIIYTEFSSVEGICHGSTTFQKEFFYDQSERPIIAQIFGTDVNCFYQAAILCCELGFDGIDINMGCPAKNVAHRGAGAGLIHTPKLAQDIIKTVQQATNDWSNGATIEQCADIPEKSKQVVRLRKASLDQLKNTPPVSIKTRVGYDTPDINNWIATLLEMQPSAIALHGRTLTQHYGGEASWELIARAADLTRDTTTLLLGNGDIRSHEDALQKIQTYRTDGVLIGRATFGNPFIFNDTLHEQTQLQQPPSLPAIALEHALRFETTMQQFEKYSFLPMRKHLGWYIKGFENASEVRQKLVTTNTAQEVENILKEYLLL
jgi:nifR3 family TIM-barrel protein